MLTKLKKLEDIDKRIEEIKLDEVTEYFARKKEETSRFRRPKSLKQSSL